MYSHNCKPTSAPPWMVVVIVLMITLVWLILTPCLLSLSGYLQILKLNFCVWLFCVYLCVSQQRVSSFVNVGRGIVSFPLLMISFHATRSLIVGFSCLSPLLEHFAPWGWFNDLIWWASSVAGIVYVYIPQFFSLGHELHARLMYVPFFTMLYVHLQ